MRVIAEVTVVPIGVGVSLSKYVAVCERVFAETGLTVELHANGTNVEGNWDAVFAAIKRCHDQIHRLGAPRIHTTIKVGTRTDREQTMADKVQSVQSKIRASAE
ncbi:MAG: MTH1187 family thiamine-binding protein [Anaerolineae bacterium]|jgi:uncharacterized protein (TIGR00106 family)